MKLLAPLLVASVATASIFDRVEVDIKENCKLDLSPQLEFETNEISLSLDPTLQSSYVNAVFILGDARLPLHFASCNLISSLVKYANHLCVPEYNGHRDPYLPFRKAVADIVAKSESNLDICRYLEITLVLTVQGENSDKFDLFNETWKIDMATTLAVNPEWLAGPNAARRLKTLYLGYIRIHMLELLKIWLTFSNLASKANMPSHPKTVKSYIVIVCSVVKQHSID